MSATSGSIESITLDGREFAVTFDAEVNRKLGGFENEILSNGNGTTRTIKTRVPWSLDGVVVEVDDSRSDQEFIQQLINGLNEFPITITYASGVIYQGVGQVVGENPSSNQTASATISMMGSGQLVQQ